MADSSNRQKLKLLHLMRMLQQETDAQHGLSMRQILDRLASEGIPAERKSVYRDIETLRSFGLDVRTYQRAPVEYALAESALTASDLALLADAAQSCPFITQRKADALVRGLQQLAGPRAAALCEKRVRVAGRVKLQGDSVLRSVDCIQLAMAQRKQVSFTPFEYDAAKRRVRQVGAAPVHVTPLRMALADGVYYLVAYDDACATNRAFRVDRMDKVEIAERPAVYPDASAAVAGDPDADFASVRAFGMQPGRPVAATFRVRADAMGAVVDLLGADVESRDLRDGTARVCATVQECPALYGWLAQQGGRVRVEKPMSLAQNYRAHLRAAFQACEGE